MNCPFKQAGCEGYKCLAFSFSEEIAEGSDVDYIRFRPVYRCGAMSNKEIPYNE